MDSKKPITYLLALFVLLGVFSNMGCKKKEPEKKETKPEVTIENLQIAYSKSFNYSQMYSSFIKQADKENYKNVASLYRALTRSEEIHANKHAELLRKLGVEPAIPKQENIVVGKTMQTLKMAISTEEIEIQSMYPNLIRTAELEKFSEAFEQFRLIKDVDTQHYELLKDAHDRAGKIPKTPYYICTECGYILTSDKTEECPICKAKKEKFEKI